MSCPALLFPSQEPAASGDPPLPAQTKTKLVERPGIKSVFIDNQTTDVRTAAKRGLAEYLSQLALQLQGGRLVRFARMYDVWPDKEDEIEFPAGIVYTTGPGTYDASRFTPSVAKKHDLKNGKFLVQYAEYSVALNLEVWARDSEQRIGMVILVEQALTAVDYQYAITLDLPHYFNARAQYAMESSVFPDTEVDVFQHHRKAVFSISSRLPLVRAVSFPDAFPRLELTVTDGAAAC